MEIYGWSVPAEAWGGACDRVKRGTRSASDPVDQWAELNWLGPDGDLDPHAYELVKAHINPKITFTLISRFDNIQGITEVAVPLTGLTSSVTTMFKLRDLPQGGTERVGADPNVDFIVNHSNDPWPLIDEALPPVESLHAPALMVQEDEEKEVYASEATYNAVQQLLEQGVPTMEQLAEVADENTADLIDLKATVDLILIVHTPTGEVRLATLQWVCTTNNLYRIDVDSGEPNLKQTLPGNIAFRVSWLMLGALDILTAKESS